MIEKASLIIGNDNFAVKEDKFLGYALNQGYYVPREIDVVRATTATRVNENGLIEQVPYNLYFPSIPNNYGNGTYTLNDAISPDGTQNASSFVPSGNGLVYANSLNTTVQTYTFSVYLKGTVNGQKVGLGDNNVVLNNFTITTSWQRYTFTFTGSVQTTAFYLLSGNYFSPAENNKFYIWGAQLVQGSTAKTYFPTTDRLDIARVDYTNGTKSLLVEPQRTNLLTYSNEFNSWGNYNSSSIIVNNTISPDGTLNADRLTFGNFADSLIFSNGTSSTSSIIITIYAKSSTNKKFRLGGTGISSGNINSSDFTATNEWQRFQFSLQDNSGFYNFYISNESSGATGYIEIYGAQLEAGSYATSYIPTVASSTVTRNADVISKTGISNLIGQTEGTLFADVNLNSRQSFNYIAINKNGLTTDYVGIYLSNTFIQLETVVGGVVQTSINFTNSNIGRFKIAAAYKNNDFAFYINGNLIGTDTSASVPTCNKLDLTAYNQNNSIGINSVQLYKTRLSNTELAQLTTI